MDNNIAIVRIRGIRSMKPKIKRTFVHLRLQKPNHCVLLHYSKSLKGMLDIVKDYVAYGKLENDTIFKLLFRRAELNGSYLRNSKKEDEIKVIAAEISSGKKTSDFIDPVFRLHPPRKGYRDIKKAWPIGELGKRQEMDSLIRRMI